MNKNAKKWIEALRSGKYKKGHSYLKYGDTFCCLGVATDLYIKEHKTLKWDSSSDVCLFKCNSTLLELVVQKWLGLNSNSGDFDEQKKGETSLTLLNDNVYKTFKPIADFIETEPKGLFKKEKK